MRLSYRYPSRTEGQKVKVLTELRSCMLHSVLRNCAKENLWTPKGGSLNTVLKSVIIFTLRQILIGRSVKGGSDERGT